MAQYTKCINCPAAVWDPVDVSPAPPVRDGDCEAGWPVPVRYKPDGDSYVAVFGHRRTTTEKGCWNAPVKTKSTVLKSIPKK